ncbi:MAG: protein kinase [Holophaga sp.]|nr:protein kinase [Holophaga sp.]
MFEKLGKFQIKRLLGQGAMGEVYLGMDPAIGREVAIKTIIPTAAQGDEAKARFEREARAAGVLNHPHLVTIYEFGEDQGVLFIAMEYVRGHDLEELFRDQSLSRTEALEVLAQVCDGLNFAHRSGIVHRDIKPSNVRVTQDGKRLHAKVMDFGVARVSNSEMTATGMVMGTVSYMAPEYIRTGKPDPRSDLFAVGVMLYEVLSGRKPFAGDTTPTILYKIVNEPPDPIDLHALAGISPAIRLVLDRALAKDPDVRFQTAEDLARALRAAKDPTWQGEVEQATLRITAAAVTAPVGETALPPAPPAPVTVSMPSRATDEPKPRKSKAGVLLAAGFGALVLLGGGAYAAYRALGSNPSPVAASVASDSKPEVSATPKPLAQASGKAPTSLPQATPPQVPEVAPSKTPTKEPSKEVFKPAPSPTPAPAQEPKFAQETLGKMDVPERKNLSNITQSEAIQLADSDPKRALEGFLNAIAANPTNPAPYAWAVAVLYENRRYSEIPPILAKARRNGITRGQMASNIRFRMAMQREAMNRNIPGGSGGDE